jgi:hypothetical protein
MRIFLIICILYSDNLFGQSVLPNPVQNDSTSQTQGNTVSAQPTFREISNLEKSANLKIASLISGFVSVGTGFAIMKSGKFQQGLLLPTIVLGTVSVICSIGSVVEFKKAGKAETQRLESNTTGNPK